VTDEYWEFKITTNDCSSICNARLEKLPDQCYLRVTSNTGAFAHFCFSHLNVAHFVT